MPGAGLELGLKLDEEAAAGRREIDRVGLESHLSAKLNPCPANLIH